MFQCIARTIDTGALAVPNAEHSIDSLVGVGFNLLRAENCGRREVFVYGRQEFNVALFEKRFGSPEFKVIGAQGGATIAANKAGCVQAGGTIDAALHQRNTHKRLCSREEYTA